MVGNRKMFWNFFHRNACCSEGDMFQMIGNSDLIKLLDKHLCLFPSIPFYSKGEIDVGDWSLKRFSFSSAKGYFSDISTYGTGVALVKNGVPWMSCTPLEFESHLCAEYSATGKVVVAGLGLGMIANSLLQKNTVKRLIVLEKDADLIKNYESLISGKTLRLWRNAKEAGRLVIHECDCLKPLPPHVISDCKNASYLWVDVWEKLLAEEGLGIAQCLQKQIQAQTVDLWGVELEIMSRITSEFKANPNKDFIRAAKELELPVTALTLSGKSLQLYVELSIKAMRSYLEEQQKKKVANFASLQN